MRTSFYILMGIIGIVALLNLLNAKKQNNSKAAAFGVLLNGVALVLIVIAVVISLFLR